MYVVLVPGVTAEGPLGMFTSVQSVVDYLTCLSISPEEMGRDISDIVVYMPNGTQLEAYDFLDQYRDEPLI